MPRSRAEPTPVLLDSDTWEVPYRLTAEDLYLQAGTDRRSGGRPVDDREDER